MNKVFQQKSKTFALRSYWNFWNSEKSSDAYQALFNKGLSDKTMQDFALGWNEKPSKKRISSFGLEGNKHIVIPEGIVVPRIINKEVTGFTVVDINLTEIFRMEGSLFPPVIFNNKMADTVVFKTPIDGYLAVQDFSTKINIIITDSITDDVTKILKESKSVFIEESLKESYSTASFFNKYENFKDFILEI